MLEKELLLICDDKIPLYKSTITCAYYSASGIVAYGYVNSPSIGSVTGYRNNVEYYPRLLSFYFNQPRSWICLDFDDGYNPTGGASTIQIDLRDGTYNFPRVTFTWGAIESGRNRFRLHLSASTYPTLEQVKNMFKSGNVIQLYYHVRDLG